MKFRLLTLLMYACLISKLSAGQDFSNIKYGRVEVADFNPPVSVLDSGTNALIIKDFGNTEFIGNESGFFSLVFTRFIRVKILNKSGINAGHFNILLRNKKDGKFEKITDIKGVTYHLSGQNITETKLALKSVLPVKYNENGGQLSVTMPSLDSSCLFDLYYKIESNYFVSPPAWTFQRDYPCLWNEFKITIPSVFHYHLNSRGDDRFDIKSDTSFRQYFSVHQPGPAVAQTNLSNVTCISNQYRWVKKNIPALKALQHIYSPANYISGISFYLDYYQQDEHSAKVLQKESWNDLSKMLMSRQEFGLSLDQENTWMDAELDRITAHVTSGQDELDVIYKYVRDNFSCTDHADILITSSLKDVFNRRSGNVGELNLLLTAMLRHVHIKADPAILRNRIDGEARPADPNLQEYNYLICVAGLGKEIFLLDASQVTNPFDRLPSYCYNGTAIIINSMKADFLLLSSDSVTETRTIKITWRKKENGIWTGSALINFNEQAAMDIRRQVSRISLSQYFNTLLEKSPDLNVGGLSFDSLENPDHGLALHYDFENKVAANSDIMNLIPVPEILQLGNPFSDTSREILVEMPAKLNDTSDYTIVIPDGYEVQKIPGSLQMKLGAGGGSYAYNIKNDGKTIRLLISLKLEEATFKPEDFRYLNEFFSNIIRKENGQIIFKKL